MDVYSPRYAKWRTTDNQTHPIHKRMKGDH